MQKDTEYIHGKRITKGIGQTEGSMRESGKVIRDMGKEFIIGINILLEVP